MSVPWNGSRSNPSRLIILGKDPTAGKSNYSIVECSKKELLRRRFLAQGEETQNV
jgi:hypothetical protein